MSDIKIIENSVPSGLFTKLSNCFEIPQDFPWYYVNTAYNKNATNILDYSWAHSVYKDGKKTSFIADLLEDCLLVAAEKAGEDVLAILRIRLGMITVTNQTHVHEPHVDFYMPHRTGLLYITDSDGDTIFYNELHDPSVNKDTPLSEFTIQQSVTPTANKFVSFNGLQYHSSSTPTKTHRRIAVNFNYLIKE